LRIKVTGPTLTAFHESFSDQAIELWSDAKRRRPNQSKRKQYLPRNGGQKRTRETESAEFLEEWLADINGDTERSSDSDVRDEDGELEEINTTLDVNEVVSLSDE